MAAMGFMLVSGTLRLYCPHFRETQKQANHVTGEIKNTGQDPYTVDYNYCTQSMAAVRDQCHGDGEETYGGEWHDTIWVVADTNAA